MGVFEFLLQSDDAGVPNGFLLVSDGVVSAPIAVSAQQAQQGDFAVGAAKDITVQSRQPQSVAANLVVWAYTTLAAPLYEGPGGIPYSRQFTGTPAAPGDIIAYDPTLITIYPDGTIGATDYGLALAQYNDGTGWSSFLISITPWDVNPQHEQQVSLVMTSQAAIEVSAQQGQQINFSITPASTVQVSSQQQQRMDFELNAQAGIAADQQHPQQSTLQVAAAARLSADAAHRQQVVVAVSAAVSPAVVSTQGQQALVEIIVPFKAQIAVDPQQGQQATVAARAAARLSAEARHQQQRDAEVLVPYRPPITADAQHPQQSVVAVAAAQTVEAAAQHEQQRVTNVIAFPIVEVSAQQGQQSAVSLPVLPAPVIEAGAQQEQQATAEVLAFPSMACLAQQAQRANVEIKPAPAQLRDIDPELLSFGSVDVLPCQALGTKVVYLGRDNIAVVEIYYNGVPLDLEAVTVVELGLMGTSIVISSNDAVDVIQWEAGSNVLKFKLGDFDVPVGIYPAALVFYDFSHPDGQVIAGSAGPVLKFEFAEDQAA